jgi:hypothetical protein
LARQQSLFNLQRCARRKTSTNRQNPAAGLAASESREPADSPEKKGAGAEVFSPADFARVTPQSTSLKKVYTAHHDQPIEIT